MTMRAKIILAILLINAVSFIGFRIWWGIHDGLAATLEVHINNPENQTMTYLVAANLNQADTAFDFMKSEFEENYTFVQFSTKGWSAKATAKLIMEDIREHGYQARVFTISLGDHVARYLEANLGGTVEVYAINPCPNRDVLQSPLDTVLQYGAPVAEVICHALGWVSYLPIIPSYGGSYSIALLVDQYWCIYYDYPPVGTSCTYGVICSTQDTLLDNDVIEATYLDAEIEYVDCGHSDIVNSAEKYHDAISNLLKNE